MTLNEKQINNLVALFFIHLGRFPAGTNKDNWKKVTIADLHFDDPPLPGKPDSERQKYAELLLLDFNKLGVKIPGLEAQFDQDTLSMGDLSAFCLNNQQELEETHTWG